jgi:hypothetical protein
MEQNSGGTYALPWLLPVPYQYSPGEETAAAAGFSFRIHPEDVNDADRLEAQAIDMGLVDTGGMTCDIFFSSTSQGPAHLYPEEMDVLNRCHEAYWIRMTSETCLIVAGGYAGAVYALVRLSQWLNLNGTDRNGFQMLDFPRLEVRAANRDDQEDWSLDYWRETIRYSRSVFINHLAVSVEDAIIAYAEGRQKDYQELLAVFHRIHQEGADAGITVFPMFYNTDHMLGQFLKAAGRPDLCRMANRNLIRYELVEAWELALDICAKVFVDMGASRFALWVSESCHEGLGDGSLGEEEQWLAEAQFYASLLRRVQEGNEKISLTVILSQGVRDHVDLFVRACEGLPVEFVHYDGEWTYTMPVPIALPPTLVKQSTGAQGQWIIETETPPLTTWGVAHSLETNARWIAKPSWIRIAYLGMPYIRPAAIYRECIELVERGYVGIFPNCSRWKTNPWNVSFGAAAAWSAGRASMKKMVDLFFAEENVPMFSTDDILRMEEIWTHMNVINTPMEASPRLSRHRSLLYHTTFFVFRACGDPEFKLSPFEEVYFLHTWQREAAWLRDAQEQVESWCSRLKNSAKPKAGLWSHSLPILKSFLEMHANLLAAAFIICRESSPDNSKGPWKAWRHLLKWHIEHVVRAIEEVQLFRPLDQQKFKGVGFEHPSELPRLCAFQEPLEEMANACREVIGNIEKPDAFSALKTRSGRSGTWPRLGLYSVLDWPVRFSE